MMAPVSVILHSMGIRMLRYLDDWLIQASSKEECLQARETVLSLCQELGIIINLEKSQLVPTQVATYLGLVIDATTLRASPTQTRMRICTLPSKSSSPQSSSPLLCGEGSYGICPL